jgi:hypothetical protein
MFRALLGGIIRFLLWFFAFYLVMHAIRAIARAFFSSGKSDRVGGEKHEAVQGRPSVEPSEYSDVREASFSDLDGKKPEKDDFVNPPVG